MPNRSSMHQLVMPLALEVLVGFRRIFMFVLGPSSIKCTWQAIVEAKSEFKGWAGDFENHMTKESRRPALSGIARGRPRASHVKIQADAPGIHAKQARQAGSDS